MTEKECSDCNGTGETTEYCQGYCSDCEQSCDNTKENECTNCNGTGKISEE